MQTKLVVVEVATPTLKSGVDGWVGEGGWFRAGLN